MEKKLKMEFRFVFYTGLQEHVNDRNIFLVNHYIKWFFFFCKVILKKFLYFFWFFRSALAGGQSCQWNSIHHSASAANVTAAAGPATDAAWWSAGPRHTAGLCYYLKSEGPSLLCRVKTMPKLFLGW